MNDFNLGQRWINQARPELGLGTVVDIQGRTVTLTFGIEQTDHVFAMESAPLARIRFSRGDLVRTHGAEEYAILRVEEHEALLIYFAEDSAGVEHLIPETQISPAQSFNRPVERLLHGQIDDDRWFSLRSRTLHNRYRLYRDELWGMLGGRTALLPHQLYVAHEIARRYAPRVLLADEVGLGKTIEAGLIAHYQITTERARRVLIVVPASLLHQWLVEMIRRFNLMFRVFDAERCEAMDPDTDESDGGNPFLEEQLVICTLEFLVANPERWKQCVNAGWDLTIVDEAHHLHWHDGEPGDNYLAVEALAANSAGILLLTGTPRQLGLSGHFARLRLLDPARYHDAGEFAAEQDGYAAVADMVEKLLETDAADESLAGELSNYQIEPELLAGLGESGQRQRIVDRLLDQYGTGRVMFRNTRASVKGFPGRRYQAWPLETVPGWPQPDVIEEALNPEIGLINADGIEAWQQIDARLEWLAKWLQDRPLEKALVICASRITANAISTALKQVYGLRAAVFHEHMSMLERDRAAAWFAEQEEGGQALVCSEIGSEGRNFQFAHHLVLFDLPLNPDLLEQRIGRLDRIGRNDEILVHVPQLEGQPQQRLARWYHEALNAFESIGSVNQLVFERYESELAGSLLDPAMNMDTLIDNARQFRIGLENEMRAGRDRLLEYHSCRPLQAETLVQAAREADSGVELGDWMDHAFGCYDINMETYRPGSVLITPGPRLVTPIPGLSDEGVVATFNRNTALENEDLQFLTWEHPLVVAISDLVLNTERGNTAMTGIRGSALKRSELAIECVFVVEVGGVTSLEVLSRAVPMIEHRVVHESGITMAGFYDDTSNHEYISLKSKLRRQVVDIKRREIQQAIEAAMRSIERDAGEKLREWCAPALTDLAEESARLKRLREVNPSVRGDEIQHLDSLGQTIHEALTQPRIRLDSLRVLVGV